MPIKIFCNFHIGAVRLMNPCYKRFVIAYLNAEDNLDQNLIVDSLCNMIVVGYINSLWVPLPMACTIRCS